MSDTTFLTSNFPKRLNTITNRKFFPEIASSSIKWKEFKGERDKRLSQLHSKDLLHNICCSPSWQNPNSQSLTVVHWS
ncbi:hypothetical protein JTE90_004765 [Oedothorax gibbosus]|uniref:Uncharacterized protein n=1 Tax=Oedothorax gibbosus TaxID=931172 RepID=A0AAV6UVY4_9ARAC|nr:hypothetical protein JTE90_004765 [Oedothorax gibbosus]